MSACQPAAQAESISGVEDLEGKTVGAQIGTTGAMEIEKIPGATLRTYDTYDLAFLDLANGQIDGVVADYPTARDFVARNDDKLMTVGEVFTDESYGIAICNDNTELQAAVNEGLAAVKANGTLAEIEEKWLANSGEGDFTVEKFEGMGEGQQYQIATDAVFPPFETVDETTQELVGFDMDLFRAIAKESNINFQFVNVAWDPLLAGVASCQFDAAISGMTITDERKEQFLFSDPYTNAGQIVVINKANAPQ
jgi:polar amino acid transport system substrate-binding protein